MTAVRLIDLLPPWYREVLDYQAICEAEQPMFDEVQAAAAQLLLNLDFLSMDLASVELWERALQILPEPAAESLDFRRFRLLNRISTKPPYTLRFLEGKLDELAGQGLWSVEIDYPNYTIYVDRAAQGMNYTLELEWTINHIKPAHMAYVSRPYTVASVLVAEQVSYTPTSWNYLLGSWRLGEKPFSDDAPAWNYQLGSWKLGEQPFESLEEIVAKPESTPSVQLPLLSAAAEAVMQTIYAVRINGATTITALQKSAAGSQVQVTAAASQSIAEVITKEELLDGLGNVLSSAEVYIPVTGAVQLNYRITVREGTNGNETNY